MSIGLVLGLAAALCWGFTDVSAALAGRRFGSVRVAAIVQVTSLLAVVVLCLIRGASFPAKPGDLLASVVNGVVAGGAYLSFFTALRIGPVSVVSPVVAAYGGVTVVLAVVLRGETLAPLQAIGAALATGGVVLTGLVSDRGWRGTRLVGRGVVFALRFRACGKRRYVTLDGSNGQPLATTRGEAERALAHTLADVERGIWRAPAPAPVVETVDEPTFHVFASEWFERRRREVDDRTAEHWQWALSGHLLPVFADLRPSEITVALVKRYTAAKQAERERQLAAIAEWRKADSAECGRMPSPGLGRSSINKTLKVLAQLLDDAVEDGYVETNVARGRRRRLKADKPKRTWLELDQVQALLAAAGKDRALLATMILAGLRISELCQLRWRDLDLATGKLHIVASKTDAGERIVDVSPALLDELKLHRADATFAKPDDLVFATSRGTTRNRWNVTTRILKPAVERANVELAKAGRAPIEAVTNHSLRRTFCALLYEAGATPPYVMAQMGHTSASLALEIYSKVMDRKRDTGARMDALIRGADWAASGTEAIGAADVSPVEQTEVARVQGISYGR